MLSDKKIAIAILNYNGLELLKKFLPSVIKFSNNKISSISPNIKTAKIRKFFIF